VTSKEEKERRKKLVRAIVEEKRMHALAELPIAKQDLADLFYWVGERFDAYGCDRTLKYTLDFIESKRLPEEKLVEWLREYGGGCDCEVMANVAGVWWQDDGSIKYTGF
jgi:hypothetical protein